MRVDRTRVPERVELSCRLECGLILLLVLGCSDALGPREPLNSGPFVAALTSRAAAPELEAYVSLPPGSFPGSSQATLRIVRSSVAVTVRLIEGGFDPVKLPATEGDTVEISVVTGTGTLSRYAVVPRRSRPTIVRTSPPKDKRDVALNARVAVIFSEPIDPATLTATSVQLLHQGSAVPGEITALDSAGIGIEFVPSVLLEASSQYELVLTGAIRDLQGATLQPVSLSFYTGTALATRVARVTVSPSAVTLEVAETSNLTAVMLDDANTVVTGRSVTWTSSDPDVATVKPYIPAVPQYPAQAVLAVVTGVSAGGPVTITATSEGQSASALVLVTAAPVSPSSGWVTVSVTTSGTEFAPSQYTARALRNGKTVDSTAASLNGSTTSSAIPAAAYDFMLETTENCFVTNGAKRQIAVTAGDTTAVAFDVQCRAPGQIAFVRSGHIFLANTNGTGIIQLTRTGRNQDPAWSPDGTRIAFASERGGGQNIYVMNADGSNPVALTSVGHNGSPSWSPDGRHIAFSTRRGSYSDVYSVRVADGVETTLATLPGFDSDPAWSPDGMIAFTSDLRGFDTYSDIYLMNADGSGIVELIAGPALWPVTYYFQPAWSPDGSRIAVVSCEWTWDVCFPVSTVMVANANGGGLTALATGGGYSEPTWSPDGSTLAFSRSTCPWCPASLHFVRADGSQQGPILPDGDDPSWRPR